MHACGVKDARYRVRDEGYGVKNAKYGMQDARFLDGTLPPKLIQGFEIRSFVRSSVSSIL